MYKTFKEWSALGFRIKKGEHSHKRNEEGTPLFNTHQLSSKQTPPKGWDYDPDYSGWDFEGSEEEMLGGYDWYK